MQFDLSNWHQESDLWFCWIVGQFFCLMYPLKLGDNFCQIDDRSVPVPRFEALCLKSSAIGWFGDVVSWCYSTPEISSDVRTCWNTGYDRCSKAWFWSFSPAWEARKPSNSPRRVAFICLFVVLIPIWERRSLLQDTCLAIFHIPDAVYCLLW